MSDKHEVAVQNVVDVKAHISTAQVRSYLAHAGWRRGCNIGYLWCHPDGEQITVSTPLERVVHRLALMERRQPGDVLADIAKEQA